MLKLIIEKEISSPTIPVRWCLDREILRKIKGDSYILLSTFRKVSWKEEWEETKGWRRIVPLKQMLEFIPIYAPGENIIVAMVLKGKLRDLKRRFLSVTPYERYECRLLDYRNDPYDPSSIPELMTWTAVEVVVPKELFAKEPPKWEEHWVNLGYKDKAVDQCEYRKRRIVTYPIKSIVVLVWLILKAVFNLLAVIILLLRGMRGINFRPLIYLLEYSSDYIWLSVEKENSVFKKNKKGRKYPFFVPLLSPIYPVVICGFWIAICAISSIEATILSHRF